MMGHQSRSLIARAAGRPDFLVFPSKRLFTLRSDKDLHFTESIAKDGSEQESISGLTANKVILRSVTVWSRRPFFFRIAFFSRDTFTSGDLDVDTFVGSVELNVPVYGIAAP